MLLAMGVSAPALAQATATAQSETKAIVLRPLSFFKVNDLNFGDIIPSGSQGTVRLYPDGTRTANNGIILVNNNHEPARFAGLGTYNQQVAISLTSNTVWITGPGAPMRVNNFEIGSTPTAMLSTAPLRFRIGSTLGNFNFPLGARLRVNANQAPGDYSGTFTIILNYM